MLCADETPIRSSGGGSYVHTISTDTLTLLAHHARRGIDAILDVDVLPGYRGVIMHDGLSTYAVAELAQAGHAQCHAHLDRHLIAVGVWWKHTEWTTRMRQVLTDAQKAAANAQAAGLGVVPHEIAEPIRARYHASVATAFTLLPDGPPPPKKNRGRWTQRERDAWNLATASSNGRCTVPVMMTGAVDPHRPLEIPGCQARRCRCPNARRSAAR